MLEELLYETVVNGRAVSDFKLSIADLASINKMGLAKQVIYYLQNGCLEQELPTLMEILYNLLEEKDEALNRYIADAAAEIKNLTPTIAMHIAKNYSTDTVAAFLLNYQGFDEDNLLTLSQDKSDLTKLQLLALRQDLTTPVITNLLKAKDFKTALNMLYNKTVALSLVHYEMIIRYFQDHNLCIEAIALRDDLSSRLVDQLSDFFTPSNQVKFMAQYINRISSNQQESLLRKIAPDLDVYSENQLLRKVDLLHSRNQLFSFVVMRFLYTGDLLSFMYCLAKLADVPFGYLKFAFNAGYNESFFEEIYQKANLPANMMAATSKILSIVISKLLSNEINSENYRQVLAQELLRDRGDVKLYKVQYLIELLEKN